VAEQPSGRGDPRKHFFFSETRSYLAGAAGGRADGRWLPVSWHDGWLQS